MPGAFAEHLALPGFDAAVPLPDAVPDEVGAPSAPARMVDILVMGGRIAMLGAPPGGAAVDWSRIIFKGITIKGIYGREIFETWYKMLAMLENGLDVSGVITHRLPASDFARREGVCWTPGGDPRPVQGPAAPPRKQWTFLSIGR